MKNILFFSHKVYKRERGEGGVGRSNLLINIARGTTDPVY